MNSQSLLTKCLKDHIPIVRTNTSALILDLIKLNKYASFLEIGTAYGYSCSLWLQSLELKEIVSLEKLTSNYEIAKQYLHDSRLTLLNIDAFTYQPLHSYDLIFVDGSKSKQQELVEKYLPYLSSNGTMVIDNIYLKKFSELPNEQLTKNQQKLLQKTQAFKNWLENGLKNYHFTLYDIDDGVGVITKNAK